ncbi:MAG: ATP synthase F1 subunit delta [Ruminococcus sp.]|nr:ATP synthase F1 subunit delta [Ruminococcus sp.]
MSETVKVYSNAIFQLSVEENLLDVVNQDLKFCADIIKEQPQFLAILSSPIVSNKEKISMLQAVFEGNCNDLVFNFICLLTEKNRINLFYEIQQDFAMQYNRFNNILEAKVTTCVPLTEELRHKIVDKLCKTTGKKVSLVETVDSSILGGVIIRYDNTVIDDSIKTKFKELSKQLHKH